MAAIQSNLVEAGQRPADVPAVPVAWDYEQLLSAMAVGLLFQCLILPCFCWRGDARTTYAMWFDALLAARVVFAALRRETGKGWMFYSGLALTSAWWIWGISYLVLGGN